MVVNDKGRFAFLIKVIYFYLFFQNSCLCEKKKLFSIEYSDERNDIVQEEINKIVTDAKEIQRNDENTYNRGNLQEILSHPNNYQQNQYQRSIKNIPVRHRVRDIAGYKWAQVSQRTRPTQRLPLSLSLKYTTVLPSNEEQPAWKKVYIADDVIKKKLYSIFDVNKQSDRPDRNQIYRDQTFHLRTTRYKMPVDSLELIRRHISKWNNERGYTETTEPNHFRRKIEFNPGDGLDDQHDIARELNIDKEYLRNEIVSFLGRPGDVCSDTPKGTCVAPPDCKKAMLRIPIRDFYCDRTITFHPKLICCMIYNDIREVLSAMNVSSISDNSWDTSFSGDETSDKHESTSFGDSCSSEIHLAKSKRDKFGNKLKAIVKKKKPKKKTRRRLRFH